MNNYSKDVRDLVYLVSRAGNKEKPNTEACNKMDLKAVYDLAQYHTLTSAAAFALEKAIELPREFDQAKKKAIHKLSHFDIERVKILAALEQNGVWYLPLKGILLKSFYPKAAMREMSDNDILCDKNKMDVVKSVMDGFGYTCLQYDLYNHDVYQKPPTMDFEMHRELFPHDEMPVFAEYYDSISDRMIKDEGNNYGYHLSDEDFYIYILCHINKHYIHGGTGLRSLLDVYVFNRVRYGGMDKGYLSQELEKLGLTEYEQNTRVLAEKLFTGKKLTDAEQKMLAYYIESGTAGTVEHSEYNSMSRSLGGDDSGKSKRKYLLKRIFISGNALKKQYPTVYKYKFLYPLLILFRPIKGAVQRPKEIIKEVKHVKKFKNKKD